MNRYGVKSLDDLISELRALPEGSKVRGIQSGIIHSDRGYYERNAVVPDTGAVFPADLLADQLDSEIGGPMEGWKGGDYTISGRMPVAYADYGHTGPYIGGFEEQSPGNYSPYLIDEDHWF